jgi:hypothetical protein
MLLMQLRRTTMIPVLMALVTVLCSGADLLQADEPQLVELTFMFRTDAEHFESLPMPYGDDAIGIVLDGTKPSDASTVYASGTFGSFGGAENPYYLTEGRYLAKGGPTYAGVLVTNPFLLPPHGFISLKKCEILEYTASLASMASSTYYPSPIGSTGLVFIRGWFEVQ